jgi:capsular polysaccharide export protein
VAEISADLPTVGRERSFLFLQGPQSLFFDRLGRALIARGHRVHRVNLHLGERLFWWLPATNFRGRFDDWRAFIGRILDAHRVTDVILVGDRRPYHIVACEEARARGIAVICTDFGYMRPGWITFEYDGMTTYSRFPRDPQAIRDLAEQLPEPDFHAFPNPPFPLVAALDIAFTLPQVFGRPLYPYYRWHGIFHPLAEYAGWAVTLVRRRIAARGTAAAMAQLQRDPGSYFLLPLQLATDFQIRAHSPYSDSRDFVREVVASFAASGGNRKLVVVVHPLDNGLINWRRLVRQLARDNAAAERIELLEGGIPLDLLRHAAGVVTVNSTVGLTAVRYNVATKVLGGAVYDVPGLTYQGRLDDFWHDPELPDSALAAAFTRALIGTTQISGGFHTRIAKDLAVAGAVQRLEQGLYPLPPLSETELARRRVRAATRTVVVTGAANGIGLALARAYAEPGVRLCLAGGTAEALATAIGDCMRSGAQVEVLPADMADTAAVMAQIEAFDRHTPVDLVIACADDRYPGRNPRAGAWREAYQTIELDLFTAMTASGRLADRMRRRERGAIAVVGPLAGRAELSNLPRHAADQAALLAYRRALRRHRAAAGRPTVSVARTGRLAGIIAIAGGDPRLVAVSADRAALRIRRGIDNGTRVIAFPGPLTIGLRALLLVPRRLSERLRRTILAIAGRRAVARNEVPMPGETTLGD